MIQLKTLDEIFGKTKDSEFQAKTEEDYRQYLAGLTRVEIQNECIRRKVNPRDTRSLMTTELMREFRKYLAGLKAAKIQPTILKSNDEVKKIFRD